MVVDKKPMGPGQILFGAVLIFVIIVLLIFVIAGGGLWVVGELT